MSRATPAFLSSPHEWAERCSTFRASIVRQCVRDVRSSRQREPTNVLMMQNRAQHSCTRWRTDSNQRAERLHRSPKARTGAVLWAAGNWKTLSTCTDIEVWELSVFTGRVSRNYCTIGGATFGPARSEQIYSSGQLGEYQCCVSCCCTVRPQFPVMTESASILISMHRISTMRGKDTMEVYG